MNHELIFSLAGLLAMAGWALLVLSPLLPRRADVIAGQAIPGLLSAGYLAVILLFPPESGGFGSFAEIVELFSQADALLAGWVHFLAFDLVVGAWICRRARSEGMPFWMALPCLPATFLFGPAGFALFLAIRAGRRLAV